MSPWAGTPPLYTLRDLAYTFVIGPPSSRGSGRQEMARGHVPGRQAKKPKKKDDKRIVVSPALLSSAEVQVVGKKKKPRKEEEEP